MVQVTQNRATLFIAPAANLETIPATRYPDGVDLGVAYVDSRGKTLPRGFYKLRAVAASARQVGTVEGRVQLVNMESQVVAKLPATNLTVKGIASARNSFVIRRTKGGLEHSPVNVFGWFAQFSSGPS
jgi:hypothetical protein